MTLHIVSVGPGDPALLNQRTIGFLCGPAPVILRTARHPVAGWLQARGKAFVSMDSLYESSGDFDTLALAISENVWQKVSEEKDVVYAVPDALTDRTAETVIENRPESAEVEVVPGFSYADFYLSACRKIFSTANVHICSASDFIASVHDPSVSLLVTEINDEITAGEVKNHLSEFADDEDEIFFLDEHGCAKPVPLFELDRQKSYSHLSAVAVKPVPYRDRRIKTFHDLLAVMDLLRSPDGCPWDRVQTHTSLKPYLIEEAWETAGAIDEGDPSHLSEELGDLLFQIVFHASIGKSSGEFSMQDIVTGICEKMIRRHPHVFSGGDRASFNAAAWDKIKQEESGTKTISETLRKVSPALPALRYAEKAIRLLDSVPGMKKTTSETVQSIEKAVRAIDTAGRNPTESELARILFLCAELSWQSGLDGEVILHQEISRIIRKAESIENESKNTAGSPECLTFNDLGVY